MFEILALINFAKAAINTEPVHAVENLLIHSLARTNENYKDHVNGKLNSLQNHIDTNTSSIDSKIRSLKDDLAELKAVLMTERGFSNQRAAGYSQAGNLYSSNIPQQQPSNIPNQYQVPLTSQTPYFTAATQPQAYQQSYPQQLNSGTNPSYSQPNYATVNPQPSTGIQGPPQSSLRQSGLNQTMFGGLNPLMGFSLFKPCGDCHFCKSNKNCPLGLIAQLDEDLKNNTPYTDLSNPDQAMSNYFGLKLIKDTLSEMPCGGKGRCPVCSQLYGNQRIRDFVNQLGIFFHKNSLPFTGMGFNPMMMFTGDQRLNHLMALYGNLNSSGTGVKTAQTNENTTSRTVYDA